MNWPSLNLPGDGRTGYLQKYPPTPVCAVHVRRRYRLSRAKTLVLQRRREVDPGPAPLVQQEDVGRKTTTRSALSLTLFRWRGDIWATFQMKTPLIRNRYHGLLAQLRRTAETIYEGSSPLSGRGGDGPPSAPRVREQTVRLRPDRRRRHPLNSWSVNRVHESVHSYQVSGRHGRVSSSSAPSNKSGSGRIRESARPHHSTSAGGAPALVYNDSSTGRAGLTITPHTGRNGILKLNPAIRADLDCEPTVVPGGRLRTVHHVVPIIYDSPQPGWDSTTRRHGHVGQPIDANNLESSLRLKSARRLAALSLRLATVPHKPQGRLTGVTLGMLMVKDTKQVCTSPRTTISSPWRTARTTIFKLPDADLVTPSSGDISRRFPPSNHAPCWRQTDSVVRLTHCHCSRGPRPGPR